MKVHRLNRKDGRLFAFEVENSYIRPKKVAVLLNTIDEVSNIKLRKLFSSSEDIHLEFEYHGENFMVWEPYGDSSRYWIGPKVESKTVDITPLAKVFEEYQPPIIVKIVGGLITINLRLLFKNF